jgi:hypothetical protein
MARSAAVSRSGGEAAAASALDQVDQLREAFATLSDVLVDELDAIRTEAARRWELAEAHLNRYGRCCVLATSFERRLGPKRRLRCTQRVGWALQSPCFRLR